MIDSSEACAVLQTLWNWKIERKKRQRIKVWTKIEDIIESLLPDREETNCSRIDQISNLALYKRYFAITGTSLQSAPAWWEN